MCQTLLASNYLMMMVMIMILHDTTHQTGFRKVTALGIGTYCFLHIMVIRIICITMMTIKNEMIIPQSSQWCPFYKLLWWSQYFLFCFCRGLNKNKFLWWSPNSKYYLALLAQT